MKFFPSDLIYHYGDLEPYIIKDLMKIHYESHYLGYCKNLNAAIEENNIQCSDILSVIKSVSKYSDKVRNNAGGFYNHTLFWQYLTPKKMFPNGNLLREIEYKFLNVEKFWDEITKSGLSVFGSGWVWILFDKVKGLRLITTPNQDNPYMDLVNENGYIVFGIDVWEHAYYLQYHSNRKEYLKNIFNVINWDFICEKFNEL